MLKVNGDGTIQSCFNAATGSRTIPCGFGIGKFDGGGHYQVHFGFDMRSRAVAMSVQNRCCIDTVVPTYEIAGSLAQSIDIMLTLANGETDGVTLTDRPFSIIVY